MGLLERLRYRAIHAPTAALRAYWLRSLLRNRARRGIWDSRMCGAHPANVSNPCKRVIMRALAFDPWLVVTSTSDGSHSPGSYHFKVPCAAVDIGHRAGCPNPRERKIAFQRAELARGASHYLELIGPDDKACVKNGVRYTLERGSRLERGHETHVHISPRD